MISRLTRVGIDSAEWVPFDSDCQEPRHVAWVGKVCIDPWGGPEGWLSVCQATKEEPDKADLRVGKSFTRRERKAILKAAAGAVTAKLDEGDALARRRVRSEVVGFDVGNLPLPVTHSDFTFAGGRAKVVGVDPAIKEKDGSWPVGVTYEVKGGQPASGQTEPEPDFKAPGDMYIAAWKKDAGGTYVFGPLLVRKGESVTEVARKACVNAACSEKGREAAAKSEKAKSAAEVFRDGIISTKADANLKATKPAEGDRLSHPSELYKKS